MLPGRRATLAVLLAAALAAASAPLAHAQGAGDQQYSDPFVHLDETGDELAVRVRDVLAHYENQTEDEQFAEIEAAREAEGVTLMAVPTELVPEVRALIARKQSA